MENKKIMEFWREDIKIFCNTVGSSVNIMPGKKQVLNGELSRVLVVGLVDKLEFQNSELAKGGSRFQSLSHSVD